MATIKYKQKGRIGLFDKEETSTKLLKLGNPFYKIREIIDFELFRPELEANLLNHNKKNNAGCRPFDVVMMFKIILIKRFYQLNDKQTEYQINDRFSLKEFLNLSSGDRIPNAATIRVFQIKLRQNDLETKLMEKFDGYLENEGLYINEGKIMDARCVKIARRNNKEEENVE